MKIRNGFISNSSSSCFILKLAKPYNEYTEEALAEYLHFENPVKQIYNELHTYATQVGENTYKLSFGSDYQTSEAEDLMRDLRDYDERNIVESCSGYND